MVYILAEEDAGTPTDLPDALKQRQDECIAAGGIFFPELNKCCDSSIVTSAYFDPTKYCGDPIRDKQVKEEGERNEKWIMASVGVGAILLIGGGLWWVNKSAKRAENPTEDPHDLDVLARHGAWLTQEDVAKNPHSTPSTLRYLLEQAESKNDQDLYSALLLNPNLPPDLRAKAEQRSTK